VLAERGVYVGVYEKMDRVTVVEAAARLGVKEQAIRKRIQRGTIAHDKDDDGRVHVYLDPEDGATGTSIDTGMDTLLQSLQDQIAYLRQEAEDWKEEARRKDTIIMSLTQHLPELEASPEIRAASATIGEGTGKGTASLESQESSQQHSWLHRFFFGP
jgi:predicted ArsR family transcriptional regulator